MLRDMQTKISNCQHQKVSFRSHCWCFSVNVGEEFWLRALDYHRIVNTSVKHFWSMHSLKKPLLSPALAAAVL
jgi:hypothetical protein